MAELLIGSFQSVHAPDYLSSAVDHAIACGENCFMFYNGAPQTTIRVDWQQMHREQFFAKMKEYQLDLANIIVHAPYVINPATNDPVLAKKTLTVLNKEIAYCEHFQVHKLVIHPGNAVNGISVETAIANCAKLINNLTNKNVIICLETMAGKGTEIGANFKQIKQIIDQVKNQALIGVCLDTCHIWDAGYDLSDLDRLFAEFDQTIGLKYLHVVHLNDSKNKCGSHKDRHENIGYGKIGFNKIISLAYYFKIAKIPKILETPIDDNLVKTYSAEIKNIKNKKFFDWKKCA